MRTCGILLLSATAAISVPAQTFTSLYSFDNGGYGPEGTLVQGPDGNLYGTTSAANESCLTQGQQGCGTVFGITPSGTLTMVYNFCSQNNCTDGNNPAGGLIVGADGNLYGTTQNGGANSNSDCQINAIQGCGTIFKITTTGTLTTLYNFCSQNNCTDGNYPVAGLVLGTDGNFYGTTGEGGGTSCTGGNGSTGCGTVFRFTPNGTLTTLHSFNGTDGVYPGPLVQGTDGNFYGTTQNGGNNTGQGTVFRMTPGGALTTLYDFCSQGGCTDGSLPVSLQVLVQATNGNLYGTTALGGASGQGTVFSITTSGTLTTLHSFDGTDGAQPQAGLVQGTDGNFYGTTFTDGGSGAGTIFSITPGGTLTTLYNLSGPAGSGPQGGMIQATNGTFYGTARASGTYDEGMVFSLSVPPPCTITYSGTFKGDVNISSGLVCITNGTVTGNVSQNGGSLVTSNATIGGNLQITGGGTFSIASTTISGDLQIQNIPAGGAQNQICGADIKGNLQFHNNGTAVVIGNSSQTCAGNVIGNDLQIQNNAASVQVFGDTIGGNLQCQNNSSISGGTDTAKQTQGQCAGF